MTNGSTEQRAQVGLLAELWYEQPPELDDPRLLADLRTYSPDAQAQESSITVPDPSAGSDGPPPGLLTMVMTGSPVGTEGKSRPDVSQTWDWAEAEAAVARGRGSLLVVEMVAGGSAPTPQQRIAALSAVVVELARTTSPVAISWPLSQRVSDPAQFAADSLDGAINVRLFAVAGDTEAMVMDTLGLHVFDLPDVQCHFRGRDPGEIAGMLFATGVYIFESGDVILDGNTISAPDGEGRYVCRREPALLEPARTVLDVDLGDPYAAGERDRT